MFPGESPGRSRLELLGAAARLRPRPQEWTTAVCNQSQPFLQRPKYMYPFGAVTVETWSHTAAPCSSMAPGSSGCLRRALPTDFDNKRFNDNSFAGPVGDDYSCRSQVVIIRYRRCRIGFRSASRFTEHW